MEMTGSERIEASVTKVYAALNNAVTLKQSLPGCQELTKESETGFDAVIVIKVGPIRATFKLAGTLSDLNPPHGYTLTGEGKGGVAFVHRRAARCTACRSV
jgi:carbon monoxide dehydrogenase subunit G